MKIEVKTLAAKDAGAIDLDDAVFGIEEVRSDLLQRVVKWQLAARQQGTHKTLGRSEINRTKKRFGRQKGGGTARHGARSAPQFVGGGKAHGPRVRSHAHELPKKVRALGLRHALSAKLGAKSLIILDDAALDAPHTKSLRTSFEGLGITNALVISGVEVNENFVDDEGGMYGANTMYLMRKVPVFTGDFATGDPKGQATPLADYALEIYPPFESDAILVNDYISLNFNSVKYRIIGIAPSNNTDPDGTTLSASCIPSAIGCVPQLAVDGGRG